MGERYWWCGDGVGGEIDDMEEETGDWGNIDDVEEETGDWGNIDDAEEDMENQDNVDDVESTEDEGDIMWMGIRRLGKMVIMRSGGGWAILMMWRRKRRLETYCWCRGDRIGAIMIMWMRGRWGVDNIYGVEEKEDGGNTDDEQTEDGGNSDGVEEESTILMIRMSNWRVWAVLMMRTGGRLKSYAYWQKDDWDNHQIIY